MRSFTATRKGRNHVENEDAHLADDDRGLYIIADGVGSTRGAGTASALVVAELGSKLAAGIPQAFQAAARHLAVAGVRFPERRAMATGATLLRLTDGFCSIGHVGDARCYLLRAGELTQLTRDHSIAWEQFEAGAITKDQVRVHGNQRLLTRTFSATRDFVVPEISRAPFEAGDAFLLTTDGISKEVCEQTIAAILRARPCAEWPAALLGAAGAQDDDATVVAVDVGQR